MVNYILLIQYNHLYSKNGCTYDFFNVSETILEA